jgi:hypothetical protein
MRRIVIVVLWWVAGCASPNGADWRTRIETSANMPDTYTPEHVGVELKVVIERGPW